MVDELLGGVELRGTVGGAVTSMAGGGVAAVSGGSVVMTGVVDAGGRSDAVCKSSTGGRSSAGGADMIAPRPNVAVAVVGLQKAPWFEETGDTGYQNEAGRFVINGESLRRRWMVANRV